MSPWEALGLPNGTTDTREIRRAYAAKVREHPPDEDPEAFRRIREAYELLRDGAALWIGGEPLPDPREDAPASIEPTILAERESRTRPAAEPVAPESDTLRSDSRRREKARDTGELDAVRAAAALPPGKERDARLKAALRALADRMREDRSLVPAWNRAVLETLDDPKRPSLIASCTQVGDIVLDLFEADGEVAGRVIRTLRERGRYENLERLARAVLDAPGEPRHDVGLCLAFLASSVAIVAADLARSLADRAFRTAVRKEEAIPPWLDLDRRLAAGVEARGAKPEARAFLAARTDGLPRVPAAAKEPEAAALRYVARLDTSSTLRTLLAERMPGFLAVADARYPRRLRAKPEPAHGGWRAVVAVLGLLFVLGRACTWMSNDRPTRPDTDWRKSYRETQDMLREIKEKYGIDPYEDPEERMRKLKERFRIDPAPPPADRPRPAR